MLRLEKVNGKNVWELLKLRVLDNQETFVASNDISLIEAYTAITSNGYAFPFGIYDEDTPVGFLMIGFSVDDYWDDAPAIAKGNYNLWRLMIDKNYQGHGFGKEAVRLALDFIRTLPCGEAVFCWLSYEPENNVARHLYRSFGFEETAAALDIYDQQYDKLRTIEIEKTRNRAIEARIKCEQTFQEDFISKLRDKIIRARDNLNKLNKSLEDKSFQGDHYAFDVKPSSDQNFSQYYGIICSDEDYQKNTDLHR